MRRTAASLAVAVLMAVPLAASAQAKAGKTRTEKDLLGEKQIPAEAYYGVQTARALENFQISGTTLKDYPDLVKALAEHGANASVGSAMCSECPSVEPGASLETTFERLRQGNCTVAPVVESGRIIGLLTLENLSERGMVNNALERRRESAA